MLTYEQDVKAILESVFAGYKDELIEDACKRICTLKCSEKQETFDIAISRQAVIDAISRIGLHKSDIKEVQSVAECLRAIEALPPIIPQPKTRRCKDCKYFEYNSLTKVDGIELIYAHEICSRWGDGCQTKEDGCCYLFEPQERSDK